MEVPNMSVETSKNKGSFPKGGFLGTPPYPPLFCYWYHDLKVPFVINTTM